MGTEIVGPIAVSLVEGRRFRIKVNLRIKKRKRKIYTERRNDVEVRVKEGNFGDVI